MHVDDLLTELLERIRVILDADTAAVLLMEAGSDALVARAARGLEDEVRQGVKVPLGVGFAGSIAARREAVLLDRVDSTTVANPILWEKGIKAMLGVPLVSGEEVIGVLHVGRLGPRPFTTEDADLLQVAGDRVAAALQARLLAVETAAAQLLERGLLPTRLPTVEGLEFASRYVTADNRTIGGDWYDAFLLPSGRLWLVTGDVAGHGLDAAVVMGRVRSALRAYALLDAPVAEVVALTDRKVDHFEIGSMVTLVCATAPPPYDRFDVCSAGHLPPVLADPAGGASFLELPVGPPLGVTREARREAATVELTPGVVMLLYTDGLVERRETSLTQRLALLRDSTRADAPEAVCRDVMHDLVGSDTTRDDIAVLAVRRTPTPARA
ncbi:MAG: PP2C family protein-serine/threonine phosphatase [Jatrophihabitans sp.]|uniref:PP2C family protein-serine/threonine phosphatase n=1 Tax=Jatrophihabitans sp. TaxID=1932789 RepID=UPI00391579E6